MSKVKGVFETRFGESPSGFRTTKDVDEFLEDRLGRKLKVVRSCDQNFVRAQGNAFPIREYEIDQLVDEELRKKP